MALAGLKVTIAEARERIGGRIYTHRDTRLPIPIEFGAEFIHGKPPQTLGIVDAARLILCDAASEHLHVRKGVLVTPDEYWSDLEAAMARMKEVREPDLTFQQFLESLGEDPRTKEIKSVASLYVQGFDAANPARISVKSLNQQNDAADQIEGDKQFRVLSGYDRVAAWLHDQAIAAGAQFIFKTIVHEIRWRQSQVEISARHDSEVVSLKAARAVITVPLSVLQAAAEQMGAVQFSPPIPWKQNAVDALEMGQVVKFILVFRDRFWEEHQLPARNESHRLSDLGFIHSEDEPVPTWWTQLPVRAPVLVGWVGGPRAEELVRISEDAALSRALDCLARLVGVSRQVIDERLEYCYTHNWHADPFARGAYSYVPVGALEAQTELARPVQSTLFFAGEATNTEGHCGTVHGAIATGERAAYEILASLGR